MSLHNPFFLSSTPTEEGYCSHGQTQEMVEDALGKGLQVALIAPHGMGKTCLIRHCLTRPDLLEGRIVLEAALQHTSTLRELVMELSREVFRKVVLPHPWLRSAFLSTMCSLHDCFSTARHGSDPAFLPRMSDITRPDASLEELFRFLGESSQHYVLVLEELPQIEAYPFKESRRLLTKLMLRADNCQWVFTASNGFMAGQFFKNMLPAFPGQTAILHLPPIALPAYTSFVREIFARHGMDIAGAAVEAAYQTFEGVTAYLQRIMHDAFAATAAGETCTTATVETLMRQFVDENASRLSLQLASLNSQQKELLYALHAAGGVVGGITSSAFIKQHHLRSVTAVSSAERRLRELHLTTRDEKAVRLADPLLRLWLDARQ